MNRFEAFARYVGQVGVINKLFRSTYHFLYVNPKQKRRSAYLLRKGLKVLSVFDETMREIGLPYSLTFGSLLGAIREQGFIKHDLDIDVAVDCTTDREWLKRELEQRGFRLIYKIEVDAGRTAVEESYTLDGVKLDVFYYFPYAEDQSVCAVFFPADGCITWSSSIKKYGGLKYKLVKQPRFNPDIVYVPFETIQLPVFANADEFVETVYGSDWRIPNPAYEPSNENYDLYVFPEDKYGEVTSYVEMNN